jgi:hypothetical protein
VRLVTSSLGAAIDCPNRRFLFRTEADEAVRYSNTTNKPDGVVNLCLGFELEQGA